MYKILLTAMFYFSILFSNSNQIYVCAQSTGIFEASADIGNVGIAGYSVYDEVEKSFTLSGAGENMWFEKDAFHYLYKKSI